MKSLRKEMIVHPIQRRIVWKNLKFWVVLLSALFAWGYLWYEGFKAF